MRHSASMMKGNHGYVPRQQASNLLNYNQMPLSVHTYGQVSQYKVQITNMFYVDGFKVWVNLIYYGSELFVKHNS